MDDQDIEKYLAQINKTKLETAATQHRPVPASPPISIKVKIDPSCDIRGIHRMQFGRNVLIQKDCWLNIAFDNPAPGPMIIIGDETNIGRRCTLSAANKIHIGKHVLIAPNVFIADTHHEYQNIAVPIMHQGITTSSDRIAIGDETWIGINVVIMGNVKIGRHCVIGANSVINRDVPDYSVAVGNPAKIVKIYDSNKGQWVSVGRMSEGDQNSMAR